ncbi:H-NS histone family protein [Cupriavidus gilardii]|uniref:H-NS histone family protein n=1 Tax=Cupriavidus gilardii TaxID=82541 RepID=UPI001ABE2D75|nr:H-NS histone family protein [Cupriavidus gilardii]MBO4123504.1 H-NS histone family protein [Cupriavidus gilardii]
MSEFDEARLAAAAWVRAQMDRYGLSLDDLVAAGCFSDAKPRSVHAAAPGTPTSGPAPAAAPAPAGSATPAPAPTLTPTPAPAHKTSPAGSDGQASTASQQGGVLYRNALGQCWDGTGEMPDWLQRAVNAGQTPEFYRVS